MARSFSELIGEMRSRFTDAAARGLLDEMEEQFLERERRSAREKRLSEEEIGILRELAAVSADEVKSRLAEQGRELAGLKCDFESEHARLSALQRERQELAEEATKLRELNQSLSARLGKMEGQAAWGLENWQKEKQIFTDQISQMEAKFKLSAQEVIATAQSLRRTSEEEKAELAAQLGEEARRMLLEQKRQTLAEERMLILGLHAFLQNRVGGIAGALELLRERAAGIKLPEERELSWLGKLFALPGLLKKRVQLRNKVNSELDLLEELMAENGGNLKRLQQGLSEFLPIAQMGEPRPEELSCAEAAAEAASNVAAQLEKRGIVLRKDWREMPPVLADRGMVRSALVELLTNAAEAQGEGGEIRIGLEADAGAGNASIVVTDRGPGVERHLAEKIFQAFFTTKEGHSGLGLTRALRWALLNGGSLQTRAACGRGEFVLTLPLAPAGKGGGRV